MKHLKVSMIMVFLSFSALIFAQTQGDVIEQFNQAADNVNKGEYGLAINEFEQVIAMGSSVGSEADELVAKAKEQLPLLNYQVAVGFIKQKDYEKAVPYLEKTVALSEEYDNNKEIASKAEKFLYQLLTGVGTQKYKEGDSDAALELFDRALKYMPEYPKAFLGKGLIYAEEYEEEDMIDALTKAIEYGEKYNDTKTVEVARERLGRYFVELGNSEFENVDPVAEDYSFAIDAYETALEYQPDNSMANYKLALISNKMVEYDKAVEYCKAALENAEADVEIAAINFEMGEAYSGNADYEKACEAYKNASEVDVFTEKAESRMNRIGCE